MDFWQIPHRKMLLLKSLLNDCPIRHTQSYKSTFSIRSWQFAGLIAERPLMCNHHSLCFMLSCLPQSHWAPCLIWLSASGLWGFILLPSLVVFCSVCFPLCWAHFSFLFSHFAVWVHFSFFSTCLLSLFKWDSWRQFSLFSTITPISSHNNLKLKPLASLLYN